MKTLLRQLLVNVGLALILGSVVAQADPGTIGGGGLNHNSHLVAANLP